MAWLVLGFVLVTMSASLNADIDCIENKPDYCMRNSWLCTNPIFKQHMKEACPVTCGYCDLLTLDSDIDCIETKPDYCMRNKWLCTNPVFKEHMKKACPITCGYCDGEPSGSGSGSENECRDIVSNCKERISLCESWKSMMKKYCAKTCHFCSGEPPRPPPVTLPPGKTYPPYKGECGQPEVKGVRVIAGTTPPRGAWPWQILLVYRGFPMCGGTLVSPGWVVTAAHCVYRKEGIPSNFVVRVGEHDRRVKEGSEVDVVVEKVLRHPEYNTYTVNNDIALLKLSRPVQLNKYVRPACLPSQDPPVGSKCYITGWGKTHHPGRMTDVLQQGLLPVVSNKACYEKNRHIIRNKITDAMICGGSGGTDRISGCHGDSGGPFVCNINGKWELHGSVSHGSPVCSSTQTYTVFSRTNHFKGWIQKMMATE